MNEITIKHLAYVLKQAKEKNQPQPIFFLGAGASKSGNIPLAGEIADKILKDYPVDPFICGLEEGKRDYAHLMECLQPYQRNQLLKEYVDNAKINVTHIYLAQLHKHSFVDYILTVNFDNLMLRALALYNEYPPTYDMAILNELTTTTFKEKSVVYLHGQHHGLWLLNTSSEMDKVKTRLPRIFDSIKNKRPWIFIGYSGSDPVFEHVKNLGRFDNGLFWIGYKDHSPNENVKGFLENPNSNAFFITGFDSDAFMIKLNEALGLEQPEILKKPFTSLQAMLTNINDINDEEHFKGVKERLEIAKRDVTQAINQFEKGEADISTEEDRKTNILKKEIIDLLISEKYEEAQISSLVKQAEEKNDEGVNELLAGLLNNWGIDIGKLSETKHGAEAESFFNQAFEKFKKAVEVKPDLHEAFYNWGNYLGKLAETKHDAEAESLFNQAFVKFKKAVEINPDKHDTFYNWGTELCKLAKTKQGAEAESLFNQAFEKFKKAVEIKPEFSEAFYNWGVALGKLAETKQGTETESLINQAIEKYKKATEIKPDKHEAFYNWGNVLGKLAETKQGAEAEFLFNQAFEKFKKAVEIKPEFYNAFINWGIVLGKLAGTKEGAEAESLFNQAIEKYKKTVEIKPDYHEAFYEWGIVLGQFAETKEGVEAESLFNQAIEKSKKAVEIKPNYHEAFSSWGVYLGKLAKTKQGEKAESLFSQAIEKNKKAIELGGKHYNLACVYALKGDKHEALKHLDISLAGNEISIKFVLDDKDWSEYLDDNDFKAIIDKHVKYDT